MTLGRLRWQALGLLVASTLLVSACGSSDAPDAADASVTNHSGAATTLSPAGADAGCEEAPAVPSAGMTTEPLEPPPTEGVAGTWTGVIETNCGPIEVELYADKAPVTVASFEHLATAGYWQDSPCHRLTTQGIFVLQCGDPTGTGRGAPGYGFGIENAPEDGKYPPGTLAMARAQDPNSNGGQFFIVYRDTELPVEGGGYSIFGRVTGGMDIVDRVAEQGVDGGGADGIPAAPISILSVEVTQEKASE
ncbi:peptidylprolyl isomerase [Ornithinimicrobium ciconiae]|uniref:Peptidyl-prolyl cis-trans isomerase n=1 Tax=Ornithinimicrobium ciconiae TaxID=2594265 RepID=A0A516GAX1_9MICO|nr:peptidylprolyl isomerase [Ornithinimicrobium ciconiae]QDO88659.1 peptidylprolyl isomerase [Ornithinimicrobium ciconiae]